MTLGRFGPDYRESENDKTSASNYHEMGQEHETNQVTPKPASDRDGYEVDGKTSPQLYCSKIGAVRRRNIGMKKPRNAAVRMNRALQQPAAKGCN